MIFNSIRARLQIWYGLILVVILAGFGLTAYELERGHLFGRINSELDRRANLLADAMHHRGGPRPEDQPGPEGGPGGEGQPFNGPPPRGFPGDGPPEERPGGPPALNLPPQAAGMFDASDPNNFYYIMYGHDGEEVKRSTNAPPQPLAVNASTVVNPPPDDQRRPENRRQPAHQFFIQGNRAEYKLEMPLGGSFVVGCSIVPELQALRLVALELSLVGAVILVLGLGGGWWLASRAIRPIDDISAAAAKISAGDLAQRINLTDTESELGRLATVLNSTFARLDAAFAQQQQFTSDAAHELRTPVTVMLTQTQLSLSRERSPAEYRQTLETCQRAAQRMRRLIESLLALARLDAGQESMKRLKFDLSTVIRDCADLVQPLAADRGITVALDVQPLECTGDSERIAQVLTNLLTNAIHYNRPQGEVRVTTALENGNAVITVRDTGTGIAAGDLPRVFERFYRSDKSRTSGGQGLGLSICQAIITAHGGSIEVASEVGVSTTFTVRLPVG
jgi:heavy metal sensor kinase